VRDEAPTAEPRANAPRQRVEELGASLTAAGATVDRLAGAVAGANGHLQELERLLAAARDAQSAALESTDRVSQLEDELARRLAELQALREEQVRASAALSAEAQIRLEWETRANDGQRRVEELDALLGEQRGRLEELDAMLAQERGRVSERDEQLATQRERIDALEGQLADERARIQELEGLPAALRAQGEELEGQLAGERARSEHVEGLLAAERARTEALELQLASEQARLQLLDDELGEARTTAATSTQESNSARLRAEAARLDAEAARLEAEAYRQELETAKLETQRSRQEAAAALEQAQVALEDRAEAAGAGEPAAALEEPEPMRAEVAPLHEGPEPASEEPGAASEEPLDDSDEHHPVAEVDRSDQGEAVSGMEGSEAAEPRPDDQPAAGPVARLLLTPDDCARDEPEPDPEPDPEPGPEPEPDPEPEPELDAEPEPESEPTPARSGPPVPPPGPVGWSHSAQLALTAALVDCTSWRAVLTEAVRVIGSRGGWDAVVAWTLDGRAKRYSCTAIWCSEPDEMGRFQSAVWQSRQDRTETTLGRIANEGGLAWFGEPGADGDIHFAMLASEGLSNVVLVPVRHEQDTVAVLELCATEGGEPDEELWTALESVATEMSYVRQVLSTTEGSRWPSWRRS
jgi:hypothetical protein